MMIASKITALVLKDAHMRSESTHVRNNNNMSSKFRANQKLVFMLFQRSNTNMREFIVIYVLT